MPRLDHTIVHSTDRFASARFMAGLLDAPEPKAFGPFAVLKLDNGVALDYAEHVAEGRQFVPTHYAFLVTEDEFDAILGRIQAQGLPYWADPRHHEPQTVNRLDGGRGVYIDDPDGHSMEFLTAPTPTNSLPGSSLCGAAAGKCATSARRGPPYNVTSGTPRCRFSRRRCRRALVCSEDDFQRAGT
jgi:catechol 2,3-dioxygenase-like lactoylglutathione lyase family enzyme